VAESGAFTIASAETFDECNASPAEWSPQNTHLVPTEGARINKVAFGSCFDPTNQKAGPALWQHVRKTFGGNGAIWNWLGDNMYKDTNDSQAKRQAYNSARGDSYYSQYGPVADPKIPTTGTWDDHDFGYNNDGDNYVCRESSQNEFVYHFNLPETDPRHPAYAGPDGQRKGVYSSYMFSTDTGSAGIHLINLDCRYHRSPTYIEYGTCQGALSTMLGSDQWEWLENELKRPSEIKVIGSGIQVLPPTNLERNISDYCAYGKSSPP
jgi:alkaline phosphatase D